MATLKIEELLAMIQMFLTAGFTAVLWSAIPALPAAAQTIEPDIAAREACPAGWAWDQDRKKCVRVPRGSYEGN